MKNVLFKTFVCMFAVLLTGLPAACSAAEAETAAMENSRAESGEEIEIIPETDGTEENEKNTDGKTETDEETETQSNNEKEEDDDAAATVGGNEETKDGKAQYILILADSLNVRTGAGNSYPSLGYAEADTLLCCGGKTGNWYQTYYLNQTAYVSANSSYTALAVLDTGSDAVERVIEEGLKLLGTPYVYGAARLHDGTGVLLAGFTSAQFDCSSLMQYIFYYGAGALLNTTTRTQVSQGTYVAKEEIQRGDLLFFTNASRCNNTGVERVGHVALYLGGNYILHTSSDYAKIEQISTQRWNYYITARRIISR